MEWLLEGRSDDGVWRRVRGYKTESGALNALHKVGTMDPYRIVTHDREGRMTVHAARN